MSSETDFTIVEDKEEKTWTLKGTGGTFKESGTAMAVLKQSNEGRATITWLIYGPQQWHEAKLLVAGLLELGMIADNINYVWETRVNGRKKNKD